MALPCAKLDKRKDREFDMVPHPRLSRPLRETTEVPVPYAWLRGSFPQTPDEYDAYESVAKVNAANGVNQVWECYVAGLVSTNAARRFFRVKVEMP